MEDQKEIQLLVDRAKAGDHPAFNRLLEESRGQLEGVLRAMPTSELQHIVDVEEVVQETFARAFEIIQDF